MAERPTAKDRLQAVGCVKSTCPHGQHRQAHDPDADRSRNARDDPAMARGSRYAITPAALWSPIKRSSCAAGGNSGGAHRAAAAVPVDTLCDLKRTERGEEAYTRVITGRYALPRLRLRDWFCASLPHGRGSAGEPIDDRTRHAAIGADCAVYAVDRFSLRGGDGWIEDARRLTTAVDESGGTGQAKPIEGAKQGDRSAARGEDSSKSAGASREREYEEPKSANQKKDRGKRPEKSAGLAARVESKPTIDLVGLG